MYTTDVVAVVGGCNAQLSYLVETERHIGSTFSVAADRIHSDGRIIQFFSGHRAMYYD